MKLDTTLDWVIKCPKCGRKHTYGTDNIFCEDEHLVLVFDVSCKTCGSKFGYTQRYTNDSSTDETISAEELKNYL